jgi:eukaryotic-like serine/threonine-protein kinase
MDNVQVKPGDILGGRFELTLRAGAGGMGEVFQAKDRVTGDAVAVKVMLGEKSAQSARFAREVQVLSELQNPGIVRYVAHGVGPDGEPFLAMEWLSGEDLSQRLSRGALSVSETVKLGTRVAAALASAHASGVVHRDLKPSNLFLVEGKVERVKVLDFGIAWQGGLTRMTRTGAMVGTPGYMAPEQARGQGEVDARADVFSLGCVLFECLTGTPAFRADNLLAVLARVLLAEVPRLGELLGGVPHELEALVAQMLAKQPELRPRDGAAVAAALSALGTAATALWEVASGASNLSRSALTNSERRIVSVVVAGRAPALDTATLPLDPPELQPRDDALSGVVETYGGKLELLADGSLVVTLAGMTGVATDQAAQAARCALGLRARFQDRPIALATGWAQLSRKLPVGDAIDRAARLLSSLGPKEHGEPWLVLDEVTAGLLDARFEVVEGRVGFLLRGEHALMEGTRTLLGKATPCVGRDWELATLEGFFHECVEEPLARAVLVTAPAGMGKSRLGHELVGRLRSRFDDVAIWIGRIDSLRAGSAFGLLGQVLRSALGVRDGEPLDARQQAIEARVMQHVAEQDRRRMAEFLGEIVAAPFPEESSAPLRLARQNAQLMGDQMQRAWVDFLRAETAARPVLVVLEDLHWGDLPTVRFLDAALREVRGAPWMVVALARPEVHERFPKLWAERNVQEIRLKELSRKASERLVRQVLGGSVGTGTIERIVAQADGHAFYLEELIRAVAEKKSATLPETVLAMVEARLVGLPPEARRVLRAASVFGEVCWQGGVIELLGEAMQSTEVGAWIDKLVEREVLVRRPESRFVVEPELAFRHALLREGAYATLTEDDRALGHRLAGAWLLQCGEGDPMVLAEHFERGGEPSRAVTFYVRATEQARRGQDTLSAIARAERTIRCGAEGEAYVEMTLIIAESLGYNLEWARSLELSNEALSLTRPGSRLWSWALGGKCVSASFLGAHSTMMEVGLTLRSVEPEPEAAPFFVYSLSLVSWYLRAQNQFELADDCALRMEQIGRPLMGQDPWVWAWIEAARAARAGSQGNAWAALTHHQRAEASFTEAGDKRNISLVRVFQGLYLILLGAYAEGQGLLEALLGNSEATPFVVAHARVCLIMVKAARGALDEALGEVTTLAAILRPGQDPGGEVSLRLLFADLKLRRGDLEAAEREALTAIDVFGGRPRDRALALATLADIRLAQRRPAEALAAVEQALAALAAVPPAYRAGAYLPLVHAEALFATGDDEGARAAIAAARVELLARADQVDDPAYRKTFLENVPENARTLARARQWLGEEVANA